MDSNYWSRQGRIHVLGASYSFRPRVSTSSEPLVKVLAPSVPAAFPLRDAPVARFFHRTSRRSTGTRTAATATRAASEAAPAPSALG